ncbi:MAG TPA: GAF domain-containing protein [Stellaceae bacterium]|nr:GAF domain-containing protein [Stellaceae bacterium]
MKGSRAALTVSDIAAVAELSATAREPAAVFDAVAALAQRTIGHRLFTVMRLHAESAEVERLYSSLPAAYPVSGRKAKQGTPWGEQVLDRGEIFIANSPGEVERAFSDHALIFSLGIGAIMNVPIRFRGRSLGTMNLCHEAGWFGDDDRAPGRLLASLLVPALLQ